MLRRIVSLGQQAPETDDDPMPPPPNDVGRSSDSRGTGGLASVFKGLTGSRLTRSPPIATQTSQPATVNPGFLNPALIASTAATATLSSSSIASTQSPSEPADTDSVNNQPQSKMSSYNENLELLANGSLDDRIAAAAALRCCVDEAHLDSVYDVWHAAQDLVQPGMTSAARRAGWELLADCANHPASTNLERREYFQTIAGPVEPEDFQLQLATLVNLTHNGRDLSGFDYEAFPLLTEWFETAYKTSRAVSKKEAARNSGKNNATASSSSSSSRTYSKENVDNAIVNPYIKGKNLTRLFALTTETIKYSSKVASDGTLERLLSTVLDIAMNTSTEDDLSSCISIISACVLVGAVPGKSLDRCVKVLSSIYCLVSRLEKPSWAVLANIFKSHHGLNTLRILIDVLLTYPTDRAEKRDANREVKGALAVLRRLAKKSGSTEYPAIPLALLVNSLGNVADETLSQRVIGSILQLINLLFNIGDGVVCPLIVDEDWAALLAVATTCAKRSRPLTTYEVPDTTTPATIKDDANDAPQDGGQDNAKKLAEEAQNLVDRESAILTARIENLLKGLLQQRPEYTQRNSCISFLAEVHPILPDSGAELVLSYFREYSCCFPSDPQGDANLRLVLDAFYANRSRSPTIRLLALQTAIEVHDVLELVDGAADAPDAVADLVRRILARVGDERDTVILHQAINFSVSIAASVDASLFSFILESLGTIIKNDERRRPVAIASIGSSTNLSATAAQSASGFVDQSTSDIAARGLVQIFIETLNIDAIKTTKTFAALVGIARDEVSPVDARLTSLKLLFRIRADWANRIFLIANTESESMASVLLRTEDSMGVNTADEGTSLSGPSPPPTHQPTTRPARGVSFSQSGDRAGLPIRPTSGFKSSAPTQKYRQLWSLPDPDALPLTPSTVASSVVFSHPWEEVIPEGVNEDDIEAYTGHLKPGQNDGVKNTKVVADDDDDDDDDDDEDNSNDNDGKNKLGGATDEVSKEPHEKAKPAAALLNVALWMEVVYDMLTKGTNWELYSFTLVHLPSQLSNHAVCRGAIPVILRIRKELCEQIRMNSSQEPPAGTGLRKPEVQTCLLHILTMILSYHEYFQRQEGEDLVRTFIAGLTDKNPICCVHALSICCYELPNATSKSLVTILQKLSQIITRSGVAMHILELLACLSRLPWLYSNFRDDEFRIAFGVCFRYLQAVRDRRASARASHNSGNELTPTATALSAYGLGADPRSSDRTGQAAPSPHGNASDDLPQYVYALAYHVLTFWFLALRLPDRPSYINWIASRLFIDNDGRQITDEQAQITLDFMQRLTFSEGEESMPEVDDPADLADAGEAPKARHWIIGSSIVTVQRAPGKTGLTRITKRQPSATSYYTIRENLRPIPSHQTRSAIDPIEGIAWGPSSSLAYEDMVPSHILAQLFAPFPQALDSPLRPIPLPDEEAVSRSFRAFDRNSTVDGHKVGVIYIGEGQTEEGDILSNISGSSDYVEFLNGLGTLVKLKGATFNTQGLDREYDSDGAYTFCWRDRVTEMVFHVTTQMPTNRQHDPNCINKKRHIGNDYVNIIFNDSGLPFRFDTFPSDFNYVNIVIEPESRASFVARRELSQQKRKEEQAARTLKDQAPPRRKRAMPFYKVQVMSKPGFPEVSPAAETKIISLQALPSFIRLLALNASVFSLVWANRQGGEHVSSWRNRLREINRLRERYGHGQLPPLAAAAQTAMGGGGGGGNAAGAGGGANTNASGANSNNDLSRPSMSGMRDSFNSLRRSSMATFFVGAANPAANQRSSVHSTATATTAGSENTEILVGHGGTEAMIESLDFSRWA